MNRISSVATSTTQMSAGMLSRMARRATLPASSSCSILFLPVTSLAEPTVPIMTPDSSRSGDLRTSRNRKRPRTLPYSSNCWALPASMVIWSVSRQISPKVCQSGLSGCLARSRSAKKMSVLPMGSPVSPAPSSVSHTALLAKMYFFSRSLAQIMSGTLSQMSRSMVSSCLLLRSRALRVSISSFCCVMSVATPCMTSRPPSSVMTALSCSQVGFPDQSSTRYSTSRVPDRAAWATASR